MVIINNALIPGSRLSTLIKELHGNACMVRASGKHANYIVNASESSITGRWKGGKDCRVEDVSREPPVGGRGRAAEVKLGVRRWCSHSIARVPPANQPPLHPRPSTTIKREQAPTHPHLIKPLRSREPEVFWPVGVAHYKRIRSGQFNRIGRPVGKQYKLKLFYGSVKVERAPTLGRVDRFPLNR